MLIYYKFIKKAPQTLAEQTAIKFYTNTSLSDTSVSNSSTTSQPTVGTQPPQQQVIYTPAQLATLQSAYNWVNKLLPTPMSGNMCNPIVTGPDINGNYNITATGFNNQTMCILAQMATMPAGDAKTAIDLGFIYLANAILLKTAGSYNITTGILTMNVPFTQGEPIPSPMSLIAFSQWMETELQQNVPPGSIPTNICAAQGC